MRKGQLPPGSTVLVTGAAGFIGSHAAERLLAEGHRVVGVDNFCDFYDRAWKETNLKTVSDKFRERIDVEEIDIEHGPDIDRLVRTVKPDAILHLAAMAGVRPSIERPAYYARVNVVGTTHLLEAARQHGVGRFAFASSSSVYGNLKRVPFREEDNVAQPVSPYAATKRAGELICYTFHHLYQLPIACLRFFTVYGPRQRPDLAIHKFTRLIDRGEPVPFFGDGSTSRDYTFVDDTVSGIVASLHHIPKYGYRVYNLGNSSPTSLTELVEGLERAVGKKAVLDKQPRQPGDVDRTFADVSLARDELGYEPSVSLDEGLSRFVAWYREFGELYRLPGAEAMASAS
ncbi:MAG: GDP-mannose 4,6-dehydratase [Planctomycetota bacterium]